jgi:hypothetical protein
MSNRSSIDQAAYDLCTELGYEPMECVPRHSRECPGFDGDYFLNWARDAIAKQMALRKVLKNIETE